MHILQAHGRPGRIFGKPALFFCPVHVRFVTDRIALLDPTPQRATWLRAVIRLLVQPYCRRSALLAFLGGTCEGNVCACDVCLRSGGALQAAPPPAGSTTSGQGLTAAFAAAAEAASELASTELVCAPEVVNARTAAIRLLSALEREIDVGEDSPTVRQLLIKPERHLQSDLFQSRTNYAALVLTLIGEGLLSLELSPRYKGAGSTARVAPAPSWREQLVIVSRPLLVTVLRDHSEQVEAPDAEGPELPPRPRPPRPPPACQRVAELEQSLRATLRVQQNAQVESAALWWELLRVCVREGLPVPALSSREVLCLRPTRPLQADAATQVEAPDAREERPSQRSQPARLRSPGELAFIHGSPTRSGPRRSPGSSPWDAGRSRGADSHMDSRHRPSWKKPRQGRSPPLFVMRSLNMNWV